MIFLENLHPHDTKDIQLLQATVVGFRVLLKAAEQLKLSNNIIQHHNNVVLNNFLRIWESMLKNVKLCSDNALHPYKHSASNP